MEIILIAKIEQIRDSIEVYEIARSVLKKPLDLKVNRFSIKNIGKDIIKKIYYFEEKY